MKISMEKTKKAMKKQFDKKRQNPQELKQENNMWLEIKSIQSKWSSKISTTSTSPNPYITCTVNSMDLIMTLNKEKKDWMKKHYKIIWGLETMADFQLQIQNLVKITDIAKNQLINIKTVLLQSGKTHRTQIGGDIYSISK